MPRKVLHKKPSPVKPVKSRKGKRGRKDLYPILVEPRLETIKQWRRFGLTEAQICENLGVGVSCFTIYKNKYPALVEVLRLGKSDADAMVESSLFRMANGYEYEERKTIIDLPPGAEKISDVKDPALLRRRVEVTKKHVVPSITAQIFYLKNRKPGHWNDRQQHALTDADGKPVAVAPAVLFFPDNGRETPPDAKGGA